MKVLHLISGGDSGGAKTHIISLLKGLSKNINVKLICFIEDSFYKDALKEGINIEVFRQDNRFDLSVVDELVDEIEKENYDIIHCHGARANFIATFLKRKIKKPFVTTIHSDYKLDFKDNFYKRVVYTNLNRISLKRFDYYIAVSDTFRQMLIERGFRRDKIFVTYNGIDCDKNEYYVSKKEFLARYNIDYDENDVFIGILARLDKVKDHLTFMKAVKEVSNNYKIKALIAGEGPEKEELQDIAKEYGIEKNVYFLGYVKDPFSFLNAIDINCLTSLSESFPYTILEGAKLNKTVITTDVGGINKLVKNGENGFLIKIGDYKELANKIMYLIDNKDERIKMGQNLHDDACTRYSYDAMAMNHIEIYKYILNSSPKVLMSGYFGFDNSGDDAILKAIVNDLLEYDNDLKIKVLSNNPDKTEDMCGVFSANRFKIKDVLISIRETDLLISGGGSLLQDVTSTRSLLYYLALMKLALIYKKPILVYANGIGPINKSINRKLSKNILNKVNFISLRDSLSLDYLQKLGVTNPNIKVTADPVFTLKASDDNKVLEILENENIPTDKKLVGISIRKWKNDPKLLNELAKTINYLINTKKVNVILIPMHHREDFEISKCLLELTNLKGCFILKNEYPVENILGIIKNMELIISMRLHTLIYATTQVTPMIGIVYDPKVEGFLKQIDYEYYLPVEKVESEHLINFIDNIYEKTPEIKNKLDQNRQILRNLSKENVELVYRLLGRDINE